MHSQHLALFETRTLPAIHLARTRRIVRIVHHLLFRAFCRLAETKSLAACGILHGSSFFHWIIYISRYGKFGSLYLGKAQQPQEQRYPFLSMCAVFSRVQTMIWLPMFAIFNVNTDADACDCTRGLHGHRRRVCTGS